MKFTIKGKSLLELRKEYGTGKSGFCDQDWYLKEDFAKEKPEPGEYEIDFDTDLTNKTYTEQEKGLPAGFTFPHPAVLVEAVLSHFKATGIRLLESTWSRTNTLDSGGRRVGVGDFGADGLVVGDLWDDYRYGALGVAAAQKLESGTLDPLASIEILTVSESLKKGDQVRIKDGKIEKVKVCSECKRPL